MKNALRWIVLGPIAAFWFVVTWTMSPFMFLLLWLTSTDGEDLSLGSYWGFSTWLFQDLRFYGKRL